MSGEAATHSEAVPERRGKDSEPAMINLGQPPRRFAVIAVTAANKRSIVVTCQNRKDAESCAAMLREFSAAIGGDALVVVSK